MGLGITSLKYRTQTRGAVDLDVLQACIGEEIKIITELYFDQFFICDDANDKIVRFVPDASLSGSPFNANLIYCSDPSFFNNSHVGDSFTASDANGAAGPFKLLEILNDGTVGRFDRALIPSSLNLPTEYLANITSLKAMSYQYALSSGNEFESPVDGSLQKYSADSATALTDVVSLAMSPLGNKDWQIDSVALVGLGDDANFPTDTHVGIKITHTVVITPLFLAGQYDAMRLGQAPDYFKPDNALKYQAQIDWNKSSSFYDPAKTIRLPAAGQFGWFGTKYNGAKSDYSISSLTIQRVSDSEFVNALEYDEVEVKFIITSTGAHFDASDSALIFGFNYLPDDEALYQNKNRYEADNFCFESKLFNPDNTPVNGNNFGTDAQVIKTINGEITSSTTCLVTVRILFGADRVAILEQADLAGYAMWVIAERTDLDIEVCDKSSLLIQVDQIYVQLTTVDLLTDVTKFLQHPYSEVINGLDTLEMFPVDDVAANSKIGLDFTGLESDGILLKSCRPSLVLTHATEADIELDYEQINLDNFPTVGSLPAVQAIDFNQIRPYKIENGIRKIISFERDYNSDAGLVKYFALNFPFMNRWEYWLQLAGIISVPDSIFDSDEPLNGVNNLWNRLANSTGWTLNYRIKFVIEQNGELFEQVFDHALTSTYFDSNTDWNNCNIKTYDLDTDDEIIVGPKKYAYGTKNTKVVASFEKTVGITPDINHIAIVIWAESFEGGGITEITRISSVFDVTSVSAFKSIDDSNRVVVAEDAGVFTGTAVLDFSKIQNLSKMSLYARIYEIDVTGDLGRVTNDFILRFTNDGQIRLVLG